MEYTHNCLNCSKQYTDNDPDVYFCSSCVEQRKQIAKEVDKKMASVISERKASGFNDLESKGKTIPSASGGMATFFNIKDLY